MVDFLIGLAIVLAFTALCGLAALIKPWVDRQ